MADLEQFRTVDLIVNHANDNTFIPKQYASAGDVAGHTTTLQVTDNGVVNELPGIGATAAWYNKSSGQTGLDAFEIIDKSKNILLWTYPQSMLTAGTVEVVISIQYQGKSTDLRKFTIEVQQVNGQMAGIVSSEAYKALTSALARVNEYDTSIAVLENDILNIDFSKATKSELDQAIRNISNGSPKEFFESLIELQEKYPSGKEGIFLVKVSDGNFHSFIFQNGWKDLGAYPALQVANSSITPFKLDERVKRRTMKVVDSLNLFDNMRIQAEDQIAVNSTGQPAALPNYRMSDFLELTSDSGSLVLSKAAHICFYSDRSFSTYISGEAGKTEVPVPKNAKYYIVSPKKEDWQDYAVARGVIPADKVYHEVLNVNDQIANQSIHSDKIDPIVARYRTGKNLFDKNDITKGYFAKYDVGLLIANSSWNIAKIKLEANTYYTKNNDGQIYFVDFANRYLGGFLDAKTFQTPANTIYAYVSVRNTELDTFQLEKGQTATPYEKFKRYLNRELNATELEQFKILVPSQIYGYANEEKNIYFHGAIKNYQFMKQYNLSILVRKSSDKSQIGRQFNYKWCYTPTKAENTPLEILIYRNDTGEVLERKLVGFIVKENVSVITNRTILAIGDSFSDIYGVNKEMIQMLTADPNKRLKMIGNNDAGVSGYKDEAWSGWGYQWFYSTKLFHRLRDDLPLSQAVWDSGWGENEVNGWKTGQTYKDLTETQKSHGKSLNPFINPATNIFDFSYYMNKYQSNQAVNCVMFYMGTNDARTFDAWNFDRAKYKTMIDTMINSIRGYNAATKIIIGLVAPNAIKTDGYLNGFGGRMTASQMQYNHDLFNEFIIENYDNDTQKASGLVVMDTNCNYDAEYSILNEDYKRVKFDSSITEKSTIDLHPNLIGAKYIADTERNYLSAFVF